MKILFVMPTLSGASGGPAQAVVQACRELKKQGVSVTIATTFLKDSSEAWEIGNSSGVEVIGFKRNIHTTFIEQFAFSFGLKKWLKGHIRDFDLVHIHYLFTFSSTIAGFYCHRYKVPYVLSTDGMLSPFCLKQSAFKKKVYFSLFERNNLKNAAAIQFTSEQEMLSAQVSGMSNKYHVIPNGLKLKQFSGIDAQKGLFRMEYPACAGKKIVLFMGRIHPIKGLDILIPALKQVFSRRKDFIFVLAGSGNKDYERRIRRLLTDAGLAGISILTGFADERLKTKLLADSDIFVLSSYHENFGMAAAEALSCAMPVVISNKVDIHKLVEQYSCGIVTEMDPLKLSLALERLLSDDQLRYDMGTRGIQLVRENFDIGVIAKRMVQLYSNILSVKNQKRGVF
ncbi:MAG: glycosyltransferase [Candidatus Omnitrophica bacterium]|nr:glycosyltransferase [Candidatus Omnitrophota bacterium]